MVIVKVFALFSLVWLGEDGRLWVGSGGNCSSSLEKSMTTGMSVRLFHGFGVERLLLIVVSVDLLLEAVTEIDSSACWYLLWVALVLVDPSVDFGIFTLMSNGKVWACRSSWICC